MHIRRLALFAVTSLVLAACASPPTPPTLAEAGIYSAGQGSAFLPYAQGIARHLTASGLKAQALESGGSIENLKKVDAEPQRLGTAFLGTAYEAVSGTGAWTAGKKHANVRALFPMYETSFQVVTLRSSGLASLRQLAGKKVGVGPAGGPAESFFKGLAEATGLQVQTVAGTPAALAEDLKAGRIDALWQGAALPIPAIKEVADNSDAVVFGLADDELAAMLKRFPFLSPATVAANTYRGQGAPLKSVAAWNFIVAHKDLPDADAYWITRTVLSVADPKTLHASAGPTRAANAPNNTVVPFHPGALRYYREQGINGLR
ncbi:MAG: TAXI family TRAP transporter solute-binding subunit [Burkholderiales bacterium]|nr:TAXI family TRAP transporter solute-binding subunit [Burkholderiales bacterium]